MNEATNINQFQFQNPEYLYGLFILVLPILIFIISNIIKRKKLEKFGDIKLVKQLMPDASKPRQYTKFILLILALSLLIFTIARPQYGGEKREVIKESAELIIALDVSNSMLAADLKPNRLKKAKKAIEKLLAETNYSNRVGLVVFAGEAYTQIPISSDYAAAEIFLSAVNPQMVPNQGTNIRAALELARKSFTPDTESGKAIILISDGENHEEEAIREAQKADREGIKIYAVGMGTQKAVPIINPETGDYRRDKNGKRILTKLNESLLKKITKAGQGVYSRGNHIDNAINIVVKDLEKIKKQKSQEDTYNYEEVYAYPLIAALILLILEFFILERKNKYLKKIKLFRTDTK